MPLHEPEIKSLSPMSISWRGFCREVWRSRGPLFRFDTGALFFSHTSLSLSSLLPVLSRELGVRTYCAGCRGEKKISVLSPSLPYAIYRDSRSRASAHNTLASEPALVHASSHSWQRRLTTKDYHLMRDLQCVSHSSCGVHPNSPVFRKKVNMLAGAMVSHAHGQLCGFAHAGRLRRRLAAGKQQ